MNPLLMSSLMDRRNTGLIVLVVLVLIVGIYLYIKSKNDDNDFVPSGVNPVSFDRSTANQLADKFHGAFHVLGPLSAKNGYRIVESVFEQLKHVNDVKAVADAFGSRKVPGCFWCRKKTFGGFLTDLPNKLLNRYPILASAQLND